MIKHPGKILKILYSVVTALLLLLSCGAATYAWFTSNRIVTTDRVSGRSGSDAVELLISANGGASFNGSEESSIVQVNSADITSLMPVSTSDLTNFVYAKGTVEEKANHFTKVENEKYYYHGRVYIQAKADGQPDGTTMNLYLDQGEDAGGALLQNASGDILNAGRLGLIFNQESPLIFQLSDTGNASENRTYNTVVGGQVLGDGQVLTMNANNEVQAVADPSVSLGDYTIDASGNGTNLPDKALFTMNLNQIYQVDIYFYVEGCDPDCFKTVENTDVNLHLAFYGVLTGGN